MTPSLLPEPFARAFHQRNIRPAPWLKLDVAKTIIFDLGGVLVHLDWDQVCGALETLSTRGAGAVRAELVNGPIVSESMRGDFGTREFQQRLCDRLEIEISYEAFVEIWNRLLRPNQEIVPLVEGLKPGHKLVLASNTDRIHFSYSFEHFPVLHQFDRHFLSYEMGLLKPETAFFDHVLKALNAAPGDCVFIDDRSDNVEAARGVGITSFRFEGVERLQSDLKQFL